MNSYGEKNESLTSPPTHVLSKGEVLTAVAPNIFPRQGILDATRINYGYEEHFLVKKNCKDAGAGEAHQRGSSALKGFQKCDSKWNSGSGALTDRPPLQPFIRHGISEASCTSTKEYHKDPILEELRPESFIERLQLSDDSLDDSRWSSGYPSSFDMSPFEALAGTSLRSLEYYDDSSWNSGYRTT
jgi:hypothetical protein